MPAINNIVCVNVKIETIRKLELRALCDCSCAHKKETIAVALVITLKIWRAAARREEARARLRTSEGDQSMVGSLIPANASECLEIRCLKDGQVSLCSV